MISSFAPTDLRLHRLLAGAAVPWDADMSERAVALRVEGATLSALERVGPVPSAAHASLEEGALACAARATWLAHEATRLSRGLHAAGIPHRLVKGMALLALVARPAERWMDDVDVLLARRDRPRAIQHLRARSFRHVPTTLHAGRASRAERDRRSAELVSPHGVPFDLHFTNRDLPPSHDGRFPTPGATAAALADHALVHHRGDPRFVTRLLCDLRALREAGHTDALAEEARRAPTLALALRWLQQLSDGTRLGAGYAPSLAGAGLCRHVARSAELASSSGLRSLWPARAYLAAHDGADDTPAVLLHLRRWRRIVRSVSR
ncbi:MAG: nucleotidyltransferase family protein [Deltaproteobacteria bacterium]|nr:nucleotidyltransferase family protein [Deltaproteobacteria bacterium]